MNRYVVVPMNQPVYENLEDAKREMEVRFIEDPNKSFLLAEIVATPEINLDLHFFDESKKSKRMEQKARILQQLSDVGTPMWKAGTPGFTHEVVQVPFEVTLAPSPANSTIIINNPDLMSTTTDGKAPITYTTTHRCKFDNNMAVGSMETDEGVVYLCEEHME
jgi:hypothetical protein